MSERIRFTLPWPPSVNHYWARNRNGSVRIGRKGRDYRDSVERLFLLAESRPATLRGRVGILVDAYPPNRIRRDIDNLGKAILDTLTYVGLWLDDEQVDDLHIRRKQVEHGRLDCTVWEIDQ
jgi:crossover junction endodeoxyribonuclease RusA